MVAVQSNNVSAVNEALNEIYVEEEDYDRLRESIDLHDNFDQIGLAQKVNPTYLLSYLGNEQKLRSKCTKFKFLIIIY